MELFLKIVNSVSQWQFNDFYQSTFCTEHLPVTASSWNIERRCFDEEMQVNQVIKETYSSVNLLFQS